MGGVTGLAVDSNDNVWVYNRPNDAIATELRAESTPPIALCCVAFSADPEQQHLYISDLTNNRIWFLDRDTGEVLGQRGNMSDSGGQFFGLHMIAVDSDGNIYTGEVQQGERVQRFVPAESPRGKLLELLASTPVMR